MDGKIKQQKRHRRHKRIRTKIFGTAKVPRFCVFRSAKHIYAQLIDDEKGKTLAAERDRELQSVKQKAKSVKQQLKTENLKLKEEEQEIKRAGKIAIAYEVGKLIAGKVKEKKIEKVVFDRAGYKYHGRVKALAEGAREGGLKF